MNVERASRRFVDEAGIGLIELLIAISLLAVVMAAITGMLISGMKTQTKIDAKMRAELDSRRATYDMEANIAEAKRQDAVGNLPVFGDDEVSFPSQDGSQWITYIYTTAPGAHSPTIIRKTTSGMPAQPITVSAADTQLISLEGGPLAGAVDRVNNGPIFTFWDAAGAQITTDAVTHAVDASQVQNVRSVKVQFQVTMSEANARQEPMQVETQIELRNFNFA